MCREGCVLGSVRWVQSAVFLWCHYVLCTVCGLRCALSVLYTVYCTVCSVLYAL